MKFQDKLKGLRKAKGISQESLGYEIGVSRQAITKWENGTAMPEVEKVLTLSTYFDVSTDYLLKDSIETPQDKMQTAAKKRAKVIMRTGIGTALLAVGVLVWMILFFLSRIIPVYSINGKGPSLTIFLAYHEIRYIGHAATIVGLCGFLLIGIELLAQHKRKRLR